MDVGLGRPGGVDDEVGLGWIAVVSVIFWVGAEKVEVLIYA